MVLNKEKTLFERDEKGELIAKEVEVVIDEDNEDHLPYKGETVFIIPMTRGEIRKMLATVSEDAEDLDKDTDGELIVKYIKKPEYTKEEIPYLKKELASILVNTIFEHSGLLVRGKTKKKAIEDTEDEFGKN